MSSLSLKITPAVLMQIGGLKNAAAIHNTSALCSGLPALLDQWRINAPLRLSHFTSQCAHESDGFNTLTEYASGAAYEGRTDLGNFMSGDGKRFKGRGCIQVTGRANYRAFTVWVRENGHPDAPDFEKSPEMLTEAPWAAMSAIWYWVAHDLNALADADNLIAVTRCINGGTNGLSDRAAKLARAKSIIIPLAADSIAEKQWGLLVLHRGMKGDEIAHLQGDLAQLGFHHGAIDGDFGAATEASVLAFQKAKGLVVDGIAGGKTLAAILAAKSGGQA